MSRFAISRHEQVDHHPHRWLVHLDGRRTPIPVELPEDERSALGLTDEQIHALLPSALERRHASESDELPDDDEGADVSWDAPVRVYQTHFVA